MFWILLILLRDPSNNFHVVRVGAYKTEDSCKTHAGEVVARLKTSTKFICVEADFPD
jgi:hypothetical protein